MADSLHARWSRDHNCAGPWFDMIRCLSQKANWAGHIYAAENPLQHMPFPLHFPNLRSIKDYKHAAQIYSAVNGFIKQHRVFDGDLYDASKYMEKLERVQELMLRRQNHEHLLAVQAQKAQEAKAQRQLERDARVASDCRSPMNPSFYQTKRDARVNLNIFVIWGERREGTLKNVWRLSHCVCTVGV